MKRKSIGLTIRTGDTASCEFVTTVYSIRRTVALILAVFMLVGVFASSFPLSVVAQKTMNAVGDVIDIPNAKTSATGNVRGQYEYNGLTYDIIDGSAVIMYSPVRGDVIIPSEMRGYPVVEIADYAFVFCDLTAVTVPDSVTRIGEWAFSYCGFLESVTIGDSVTSIGRCAFSDTACYNNSSNWVDDVLYIGNYLIKAKDSISGSYSIKDNTKCIADDAFSYCRSLESVNIPASVTSIGDYAFSDCSSLASVTIPESVISIGACAFHFYDYGMDEYIPLDLTIRCYKNSYAHTYATEEGFVYGFLDSEGDCGIIFGTCGDELTWTLDLVTGVLTIDGTGNMYDYEYKGSMPYTTAPWGNYYSYIKSVVIGDSVTSIGDSAFEDCTALTSVTIGNSVTSIGWYAFSLCTSLESVTIGNSVTSICNSAFRDCTALTSVTIGNSVTSIDDHAFSRCTSLESVTIGNSVTSIGCSAFSGCTSLESVTIGNSVTSIDTDAFFGCTSLKSVTIPDSVTSIVHNSFSYCTSLESVTVDKSNEYFSSDKYGVLYNKDKTKLIQYPIGNIRTEFVIPNKVTSIGHESFYCCTSLESVTIPDSVTSIGHKSFYYCISLESVTIPDSVTTIGEFAFHFYDDGKNEYSPLDLTIRCYENSYAHTYAIEEGFKYELISAATGVKTLKKINGVWTYLVDGKVCKDNTLVKYNGKWYHVNGGKWVKDTTLVKYNGKWYYVKNGVKNNSNTLVKYNGKWYHVNGGKWVKDTTLVKYNGVWYYVKNGVKNNSNTLVKYNGKWYHVNGGKWVKDTTLVKYNGKWYYVKSGVKNTATTLVQYNKKWYYVNKGVVDFTYSGPFTFNGKTYTIKKGIKV